MLQNILNNYWTESFYNTSTIVINRTQEILKAEDAKAEHFFESAKKVLMLAVIDPILPTTPSKMLTMCAGALLASGLNNFTKRQLLPGTIKVILAGGAFAVSASSNETKFILGGISTLFVLKVLRDRSANKRHVN